MDYRSNGNTVCSVEGQCCSYHRNKLWFSVSSQESLQAGEGKGKTAVDMPALVDDYNNGMCGVDTKDQLLGAYRPGLGGKKWWWPLFTNVINVAQVAAYKLYTYTTDARRPLSHIEFLSEVAEVMVRKDHIRPSIGIAGRHAPTSNQVRRDGINHKLISTIQGRHILPEELQT